MLRVLVRGLTVALPALVLALIVAPAAFAGELVEGDGYQLRVPPGFQKLQMQDKGT